jgi:RHH-type proline utilization regulon transcriptional repressor/proline dehydrogenase/delta 1-pyrroline-5-carboxylate dehydrogenase
MLKVVADSHPESDSSQPFSQFAPPVREHSDLRQAITAAYRRPETECLPPLVKPPLCPQYHARRARHRGAS